MKKRSTILAGPLALVVSATAYAAPAISYHVGSGGAFGATFSDTPGTTAPFADVYTSFVVGTTVNLLSGTISTSDPVTFGSADIFKAGPVDHSVGTFTFTNTPVGSGITLKFGSLTPMSLSAGTYYVKVVGKASTAIAGYAGTLNFSAAPEPAAWTLLIVGFGATGIAMRRRRDRIASC